ncbi:MAG: hypothetical protein M3044_00730 [Thermoproteota archaeon]|nr:hypothetical protein [Thermoproteota archaeon]
MNINEGLYFLLSHLLEPIFPRHISTLSTQNKQYIVYNREQALAGFNQASLLDCKIRAYPVYIEWYGINRYPPNLILIDLDLSRFGSKEELDKALNRTLQNIKEKLNAYPTVIWSGHGYHIYLPLDSFILEDENEFAKFEQPSRKFIQFAESYLTNNKADPCHSYTMSFKNCMLRVPGSFNSKSGKDEVKIIQKWNGVRPSIKPLLFSFYLYLQDLKLKKIKQHYHPPRQWCQYVRVQQ